MPTLRVPGADLYYDECGRGPQTVVFAHGLLWSGRMFQPQVDALGARFRCVRFDFRGQGRSAVARAGYDMETLTDDAMALLEALACAPCHFVGLSMGGFVGLRIALRRPELLRSLTLIDSAADGEPARNVPKYALLGALARTLGVGAVATPAMRVMFGASFLHDPARADERAALRRELLGNDRVGATRALRGVVTRRAVLDELGAVRTPTLVLHGEDDRAIVPARARRTAAAIPGARVEWIPRAGHTSTLEEPAAVTRALSAFLARVE